jgi:hypothetical protein
MAYWLVKRAYAHPEARTYTDPETGETKKVGSLGLAFLAYVCDLIPAKPDNPEAEGIETEVTRGAFKRALGISTKETFRRHLLAVTDSGLLVAKRYGERDGYYFSVGPKLQCAIKGCEKKSHYPGKAKEDRFAKRTRGEGQSPRGGEGNHTQGGGSERPLLTTKEPTDSKTQALAESEEVAQVKPAFVTQERIQQDREPKPDQEALDKLVNARLGIERELASLDRPHITENLKEWAITRRARGVENALQQALDFAAKGYDLDPLGPKWRAGSAQVQGELIQAGGNE